MTSSLACAVEPQQMIEAQLAVSPDSTDLLGLEKLPFGPTAGCDVLDTVAP
ncbi:MAG: hypothetical protein JRI23_10370 [Deltaproteobacteria bacterium]|nr:hypothetical protein [Deltaproteobacteria bacterium]MBW2532073.1 hypothetical protein [Deltaproteobacteria bacterium]